MNGNRKRRIRLCSSLERNNKESPRFWMKHTWNIDTVCGFDARGRLVEVVVMILKMALIRLGSDMRPSLFTIAHYPVLFIMFGNSARSDPSTGRRM